MKTKFMTHKLQDGFTLIEALIAFVVMTVGVLGALLFHSQLLSTSAENKSKLEAIQIAERSIEQARIDLSTATSSNFTSQVASLAFSPVSGKLNTYTIAVGTPSEVVSGAPSTFEVPITVSWPVDGGSESVVLSTYFGFVDSTTVIPVDEVGGGSGGNDTYLGSIPLPTGTMRAVERVQLVASTIDESDIERQQGNVVLYREDGDEAYTVAIKIDSSNYVKLGEFDSVDNEIFTITGRIYNNHRYPFYYVNGANNFNTFFAPVYGVLEDQKSGGYTYESADIDGVEYWYIKNLIDVEATEGANCVIGRFENAEGWSNRADEGDNAGFDIDTREGGASKQDRPADVPWYADYICVAGTGWNGTINPYVRSYSDNDNEIDIELAGGSVCSPKSRSYRYYLLDTEQLDNLLTYQDVNTSDWVDNQTLQNIFSATSTSVKGQSGLVRFTSAADSSGEKVPWSSYFWQNPNYIISPTQSTSTLLITSSVAGPSGYVVSYAETGYYGPQAVSTGLGSYEIMFPGDLSHQNFYLSDDARACDDINDATQTISDIVYPSDKSLSDFLKPSHLVDDVFGNQIFPGGVESGYGYIPPNAHGWFEEADYNTEIGSGNGQGVIVLGYSLVTARMTGSVTFDNSIASASTSSFVIGGVDSDPNISIVCSALQDTLAVDATYSSVSSFEFYCSVPNNWDGEIYAYASTTNQEACGNGGLGDGVYLDYSDAPDTLDDIVASPTTWSEVSAASASITEFYTDYLGQDPYDGAAVVNSGQFDKLGYYDLLVDRLALAEAAGDLDENFHFYFGSTGSSDSCTRF